MLMPQEIEVWEVLPALRRQLAIELVSQGHSQREAASRLGITEAAVSQYLSSKRGKALVLSAQTKATVGKSAAAIAAGQSVISELHRLCNLVEVRKSICAIHQKQSGIPRSCTLCDR